MEELPLLGDGGVAPEPRNLLPVPTHQSLQIGREEVIAVAAAVKDAGGLVVAVPVVPQRREGVEPRRLRGLALYTRKLWAGYSSGSGTATTMSMRRRSPSAERTLGAPSTKSSVLSCT
jgi:hypothetical protein